MRTILLIFLGTLFTTALFGQGEGGGDCGQENTLGKIIDCINCTVVDGEALGSLGGDTPLEIMATSCGPVSLTIEYSFDWDPGAGINFFHGISFYASDAWTSQAVTTPNNWKFMPNGVIGCCSQSQYGPGYYYNGSNETSCDLGGSDPCVPIGQWYNINNSNIDPGSRWGIGCSDDSDVPCPEFKFTLTFCPPSGTTSTISEEIKFTTSADGESGGFVHDRNCDQSNTFNITISNLCPTDASFDDIPDNYCNAQSISLNNPSSTYDGNNGPSEEWEGGVVQSPGQQNVSFSYCDNIGNTSLSHMVGHDGCYDGPVTKTFEVWTPEIINVTTDVTEGCGTVTPNLSADIVIQGTSTPWNGGGMLVWQDANGNTLTDLTLVAEGCSPTTHTLTPKFETGCDACDVTGTPIQVTVYPTFTTDIQTDVVCGVAYARLLSNDGTECDKVEIDCSSASGSQTDNYNFNVGSGSCTFSASGSINCSCSSCNAEAGTITANTPLCPGETITSSISGNNTDPNFTTVTILADGDNILSIQTSGSFTLPNDCKNYTLYSYNYLTSGSADPTPATISGIDCNTHCCELSQPFTISVESDLAPMCPPDPNLPACTSISDINTAYTAWVNGFAYSGGCAPITDNKSNMPALPSNLVCGQSVALSFQYEVSDACNTTPLTCSSTFTVAQGSNNTLTVNCPSDINLVACSTESDINTAFTSWLAGFSYAGGCGTVTKVSTTPTLPTYVCGAGVSIPYTYSIQDACGATQNCSSTFVVEASPNGPLTVTCPSDVTLPACSYDSDINNAFTTWLSNFSHTGGCGTTTVTSAPPQLQTYDPTVGLTINYTYMVEDDCQNPEQCTSTFTVEAETPLDAGSNGQLTVCNGGNNNTVHNLFNSINASDFSGTWSDDSGCGINFTNPTAVDFTNVSPGVCILTYTISSGNQCPDASATLTINIAETPSITIADVGCDGQSTYHITLTVTGGTGIAITSSDGTVSESNGIVTISGIDINTNTIITATNDDNCEKSINVQAPNCDCPQTPAPTGTSPTPICSGDATPSLMVNVANNTIANWYDSPSGGSILPNGANTSIYAPTVSAPGTYSYFVEAVSSIDPTCISSTRKEIILTIHALPSANPAELSQCNDAGDTYMSFNLSQAIPNINGNSSLNYTFYEDQSDAMNGTGSPLPTTYTNTTPSNQVIYVRVMDSNGCVSVAPVTLKVTSPCGDPCTMNLNLEKQNICFDNNTGNIDTDDVFSVEIKASGTNTATMYKIIIDGIEKGVYTYGTTHVIEGVPADGNNHTITAVDLIKTSCTATINVMSPSCSSCEQKVEAGNDQVITCTSKTVELSASNVANANYSWTDPDGTQLNGSKITVEKTGKYYVTAVFDDGCTALDSVYVSSDNSLPIADAGSNKELTCKTTTVLIGGQSSTTGAGIRYEWKDANNTVVSDQKSFETDKEGTYTLIVYDDNTNCISAPSSIQVTKNQAPPSAVIYADPGLQVDCKVSSVNLTAKEEENVIYRWVYSNVETEGASLVVQSGGTVSLTAIDTITGCEDYSNVEIQDLEAYPLINIEDPDILNCASESIIIDASGSQSGASISYQWYDIKGNKIPDATQNTLTIDSAGMYYLESIDANNDCINTDTINVTANFTLPSVTLDNNQELACVPNNIIIIPLLDNDNYQVTWTDSLGNILNTNNSSTIEVNKAGIYTLVCIHDESFCSSTDTVYVTEPEHPTITVDKKDSGCDTIPSGQIIIRDIQGGKAPYTKLLDTKKIESTEVIDGLDAGTYKITVIDSLGCKDEVLIDILDTELFSIELINLIQLFVGDKVLLDAKPSIPENQIASISWMPADSVSCSDCLSTEINPIYSGYYTITILDKNGCEVSARVFVQVEHEVELFIPNVFSPNNDGKNDVFSIFTNKPDLIEPVEFYIFDRWGNMVFESKSIDFNDTSWGWDGVHKGQPALPGVYPCLLKYRISGSTTIEVLTSEITLIR